MSKFAQKAMASGVRFTPEQAVERDGPVDNALLGRMSETAVSEFTGEQLEDPELSVEDTVLEKIAQK